MNINSIKAKLSKSEIIQTKIKSTRELASVEAMDFLNVIIFYALIYFGELFTHYFTISFIILSGMIVLTFLQYYFVFLTLKREAKPSYYDLFYCFAIVDLILMLSLYLSFRWTYGIINFYTIFSLIYLSSFLILTSASATYDFKYQYFMLSLATIVFVVDSFFMDKKYSFIFLIFYTFCMLVLFFIVRKESYYFWQKISQTFIINKMEKEIDINQRLAPVGILAMGLAHEINNPLMIISGFMDIVESKIKKTLPHDVEFLNAFKEIGNSVNRIRFIVDNIKLVAYENKDKFEKTYVNELINNLLNGMITHFISKHIQITIKLKAEYDVVNAAPIYFSHAIKNIIQNALEAIQNRKNPEIVICTQNVNNNIEILVEDNGKGIKATDINKVFDSFFSTKDVNEGAGLGLSISYSIVKALNGNIDIVSTENIGTTVKVSIPLKNSVALE